MRASVCLPPSKLPGARKLFRYLWQYHTTQYRSDETLSRRLEGCIRLTFPMYLKALAGATIKGASRCLKVLAR